jgi:hypothetical protein
MTFLQYQLQACFIAAHGLGLGHLKRANDNAGQKNQNAT